MGRLIAALQVLAGVIMILLGLLFLAGAAGQGRRVLIGAAGLALGAVLAGLGTRRFRRAEAVDPARLHVEILSLAERSGGELSSQQLAVGLGWRERAAAPVLETLLREGRCVRRHERGEVFYVFPALQPRLMLLRCDYCHTSYDLNDDLDTCPNCGGTLRSEVVSVSLSQGEVYGMDDLDEAGGQRVEGGLPGPSNGAG